MTPFDKAQRLLELLADTDVTTAITQPGFASRITGDHKAAIKLLHGLRQDQATAHGPKGNAQTVVKQTKSTVPKKRGAGGSGNSGPWKTALKMSKPELPACVETFIATYGADATYFFNHNEVKLDTNFNGQTLDKALITCYKKTKKLQSLTDRSAIEILFYYIQFYDMAQLMQPGYVPSKGDIASGTMSQLQTEVLELFNNDKDIAQDVAMKDVVLWCVYGSKLDAIITSLGIGMETSGPKYEEAMRYFKKQWTIETWAANNQTAELGKNIRALLIDRFTPLLQPSQITEVDENDIPMSEGIDQDGDGQRIGVTEEEEAKKAVSEGEDSDGAVTKEGGVANEHDDVSGGGGGGTVETGE